jgi:hypothetical protein
MRLLAGRVRMEHEEGAGGEIHAALRQGQEAITKIVPIDLGLCRALARF